MYRPTHIHTLRIRNDQYDFVTAPPYFIFFSILFSPFPRRTYKYTYIHTYVRAVIYCTTDPVARDPFVPPGDAPLVRARVLRQPPSGRRRSLSHTHPLYTVASARPGPQHDVYTLHPRPRRHTGKSSKAPTPRPPPVVDNDDCTPAGLIIRRRIPRTAHSTYQRRQDGSQSEHSFLTNTFIEYTFQKNEKAMKRILYGTRLKRNCPDLF